MGRRVTSGIIFLILCALGIWSIYSLFQWFQSLNASVAAALITASIGLIGLWYAQWQSKSRDIAESHRASKIEVYNIFFDLVDKFQTNEISDITEDNIPDWLRSDFQKS